MRDWLDPRTIALAMVGLAVVRLALVGWRSDTRAYHQATELIDSALLALGLMFVVIRPFVAQSFYIPSGSMEPTLRAGDWVLTNRFLYRFNPPRRGDVVVFRAPARALAEESAASNGPARNGETTDYIKRVIGLPGDVVEIKRDQGVYINGHLLRESRDLPDYTEGPTRVGQGRLFVLGDNRNNSNDSHAWGTLKMDRLVGKAMVIFWPPTHLGWLD
jgi:signal peptidase I